MKIILKNSDVFTLPSHGKVIIEVEKNAEVWLTEHFQGKKEKRNLALHLEPYSKVHWTCFSAMKNREDEKHIFLEEGADLHYFLALLNEVGDGTVIQLEKDSRVLTQVLFFAHDLERQGIKVVHRHKGKNSQSKLEAHGAVKDQSYCHFFGNIIMEPGCTGANGSLKEHNLILSSGAKIEAIPALEVHHDEVQASHSATLEKIDEEKLFYLQSRGLPPAKALELLVEGFFRDALQKCPNKDLSDQIFKTILRCL